MFNTATVFSTPPSMFLSFSRIPSAQQWHTMIRITSQQIRLQHPAQHVLIFLAYPMCTTMAHNDKDHVTTNTTSAPSPACSRLSRVSHVHNNSTNHTNTPMHVLTLLMQCTICSTAAYNDTEHTTATYKIVSPYQLWLQKVHRISSTQTTLNKIWTTCCDLDHEHSYSACPLDTLAYADLPSN